MSCIVHIECSFVRGGRRGGEVASWQRIFFSTNSCLAGAKALSSGKGLFWAGSVAYKLPLWILRISYHIAYRSDRTVKVSKSNWLTTLTKILDISAFSFNNNFKSINKNRNLFLFLYSTARALMCTYEIWCEIIIVISTNHAILFTCPVGDCCWTIIYQT